MSGATPSTRSEGFMDLHSPQWGIAFISSVLQRGTQVEQRFGIKLMKCSVFVHPAQGCSSEVLKASVPSKYSLPLGEKKKVNPKLPGRKYSSYFLQQAQSREPEISKSFISRNQSTAEFRTGNTHADLCIAPTNPTSLSRPWDQCFCLIITWYWQKTGKNILMLGLTSSLGTWHTWTLAQTQFIP